MNRHQWTVTGLVVAAGLICALLARETNRSRAASVVYATEYVDESHEPILQVRPNWAQAAIGPLSSEDMGSVESVVEWAEARALSPQATVLLAALGDPLALRPADRPDYFPALISAQVTGTSDVVTMDVARWWESVPESRQREFMARARRGQALAQAIIRAGQDAAWLLTDQERALLMDELHAEQDALQKDILDSMHQHPVLWDRYRAKLEATQ